ncbi:hypothetical protein UFOVP45_10 [uncultured Caudovirales phage]|uniref:Uncharacterized protein n=1 Tax=uncultured Caudovirales phage TaxID=2100421 RepID=A0A6J5KRN5_9CAUD|nr:hypothetical protein UFOVP45_10 [uncultured Caudovirales phage]
MPLIRKFAVQGHAVPATAHRPYGPFPPEVLAQTRVVYDDSEHSDSLHSALDDVRMFRCKDCTEVLYEDELDEHVCEY